MSKSRQLIFLETYNLIATLAIVGLLVYIGVAPFIDNFFFRKLNAQEADNFLAETLVQLEIEETSEGSGDFPPGNRLIIPSIGVNTRIWSGTAEVLEYGPWHRPKSSNPENGGNTVIAGHRFLYRDGPNTFYHLDKVQIGDKIVVIWEGNTYYYEVNGSFVVGPKAVEIEKDTPFEQLTLYTCTPLWNATDRLVLTALPTNQ